MNRDGQAGLAAKLRASLGRWVRRSAALIAGMSRRTRTVVALATSVLLATTTLVALAAPAQADPCAPLVNPVACENSKPGTPESAWDITGVGDESIQGFTTDISVNVGQTVSFKVKTTASTYAIQIYRLGWYNGDGARLQHTINVNSAQNQPNCAWAPTTETLDCGNWAVSATWAVPSTAVSGVYIARLRRTDTGGDSHIPFIVRNDASTSAVFFQTSDATWQAYNAYGGSNFYTGAANGRAYKLSYNRPFSTRGDVNGRDYLFANEYPMIRFLERNGYDVSYTTNVDSHRRGNLIKNHKVFLSVGHDEYWSGSQRTNVEAARDAGTNLAFFSGNEVYWRTRWENSDRTLVCYKETWAGESIDPSTEWTGTWRDPRFTPPATGGGAPENQLTGTLYLANHDDLPIRVPEVQGKNRLWRNTGVAAQLPGQTATLAPHTVGYESDEDVDNGFRPAGLIRLSTTVGPTPELLRDFGNTVSAGTTTHSMTMYRAPSGALVFSAGTIQYPWGLDDYHDGVVEPPNQAMQQAVVNLLADMDAQPATRMATLAAAAKSTDTQGPTTVFATPAAGSTTTNGALVTVTGTAADVGGGRVAGVEVSTDGGTSWHPATGTTTWSYQYYANGIGSQTVVARGIDDSANIGQPAQRQFTLSGASSIFGQRVPKVPVVNDTQGIELGLRFTPDVDGFVTGVRFYKGAGNTGTHTGKLWNSAGQQIAAVTFANESATGWQSAQFSQPVSVSAATSYVVSYYAPNGNYPGDPLAFSYNGFKNAPLSANRSTATSPNGLYRYGGGFPNLAFQDSNYYVDVSFVPSATAPPTVVAVNPLANSVDVPESVKPSATFSKAVNPATVTFNLRNASNQTVAGSAAYNATTKTVTFTPAAPLVTPHTFTATVTATDTNGNAMEAPYTWSFTTDPDASVAKLFPTNAVPDNTAVNDPSPIEVGVKFAASVNGSLIGVRFYKGTGNTGTHVGKLYNASGGNPITTTTFVNESATGWQYAYFPAPVTITAGTTYVASYYAPAGRYASTSGFFGSAYTNGVLSGPAGANGVYRYATGGGFPDQSWNSTNYWVDPLFVPEGTPIPPTPTPGPTTPAPTTPTTTTPTPTPTSWPAQVSLFTSAQTPATASWSDSDPVEVGAKFVADTNGSVTAIKFYKGTANTGTHVGRLWNAAGGLLASGTFGAETASGWQTLTLATPVPVTAGQSYVVSYHTTVGGYAATVNMFAGDYNNAPLRVLSGNGVYKYGNGGVFPDQPSYHNYWVDVVVNTGS